MAKPVQAMEAFIFWSRWLQAPLNLGLRGNPNQPEGLSHVNAGALKVRLAVALISISSKLMVQTLAISSQAKH